MKLRRDLDYERMFPMVGDNMNRRGSKDSGYGTISRLILANMIQPSAGHSSRPSSLFIPNGENPDLGDLARWMPVKKVSFIFMY